jgi:predicted adenylyl cyclase CyaB
MKNLETKVKVENLSGILENIAFADRLGILIQKDTYYIIMGSIKLKIREEEGKAEIILYSRPIISTSKYSKYIRVNLVFCKNVVKKSLQLFFDEKGVVIKNRILFVYKHTRIHLDTVSGLGEFVELETIFVKSLSPSDAILEHQQIKKMLGIERLPVISGSYSDLLFRNGKYDSNYSS